MRTAPWFFGFLALTSAAAATPAQAAVDATPYGALMKAHVRQGVVDYRALAAPGPRASLRAYLAVVASARLEGEGDGKAQLAAAINAYNAWVIDAILEGGSPATLWGRFQFFKQARREVFGRALTLEAFENDVIRKRFHDARVHFALVCASRSCPPLRSEAYRGEGLDRQLDDQARTFLADPQKNRFDRSARALQLSSIFKWYRADFEQAAGSVGDYVARYAPANAGGWAAGADATTTFLDYDWSLNGSM